MKLLIISSAPFIQNDGNWAAYAPYVKELEIWAKHADEIAFCCPTWKQDNGLLIRNIPFSIHKFYKLSDFNIQSPQSSIKAFFQVFYNLVIIFKAMLWAEHIHLRCPGNVGLLASVVQIFFPHKVKSAKYAGNWDFKVPQPISYRLQKIILSNTFWTRKINVLVYGKWKSSTKNIKPFFTATYSAKDSVESFPRKLEGTIKIVFVGTLSSGKRPLYAIQLVQKLIQNNFSIHLSIFGEGKERELLEQYIVKENLQKHITLFGNQNEETIKLAYQQSHFVLLPSQSEGWPKVVAEGMFWGCVPIATKVSCVPYMLEEGNRGILLDIDLNEDIFQIQKLLHSESVYQKMALNGIEWSRKFTLESFEQEIKLLLQA